MSLQQKKDNLIKLFYNNPQQYFSNLDYSKWNYSSISNIIVVFNYLLKNDPTNEYIPEINQLLEDYIKYCDINKIKCPLNKI